MQSRTRVGQVWWTVVALVGLSQGCSSGGLVTGDGPAPGTGGVPPTSGGSVGTGGTVSSGGSASGGAASGGAASGGTSSGGSEAAGGSASGGGAADFFGASRCAEGGFLLCDGFEGETIDSALWTVEKGGANVVELVGDQAARGSKSVHIHADNQYGRLRNTTIFPVANNDYFGRMFLRVARFSTVDWAHWTVGEAAGTGDGSLIRVGGQYRTDAAVNRWGIGSDGGPTGDWTTHDSDPDGAPMEPATGTWVCLEWEHKGSTNETHFYVDDVLHPSLSTTATEHGVGDGAPDPEADYILPEMTSFWFGWYQYQTDPEPFDVWIDEVVLDDARIGCTK